MAKAFFSADRERRRLFKVKPSQLTREPNSRKGQGLKVRGTSEVRSLVGGLTMKTYERFQPKSLTKEV